MKLSTEIEFRIWFEHTTPKVGKVAGSGRIGDFSNIIALDQAMRLIARLDPLYDVSPELKAYAASKRCKSSLAD